MTRAGATDTTSRWSGPETGDWNFGDVVVIIIGTGEEHPIGVCCGSEGEVITKRWSVAKFEVDCKLPGPFGVDATNAPFLKYVDDSTSALLTVNRTDNVVDPREINSRHIAVCGAFDSVDVRLDRVAS
jgi:hypothetical protein